MVQSLDGVGYGHQDDTQTEYLWSLIHQWVDSVKFLIIMRVT